MSVLEPRNALFPALRTRSFVSVSVTVSALPFRIAVVVTVSTPCMHHGYVNDGNHLTFLCSRSPVRLVPNGRVELPGWSGLAGEFPALPGGRSSRPGSYGIYGKMERDSI